MPKSSFTEQGAMIGSHNYVSQECRLGTAEIALLSHDEALRRRVTGFIKRQLTPK